MKETIRSFWRSWSPALRDNVWEGQDLFQHACGLYKFYPHKYGAMYDSILSPYQEEKVNLIEIGVSGGWSMLLWDQYYTHPESRFIGIDPLYDLKREGDDSEARKSRYRVDMLENTTRPLMSDRVDLRFQDAYAKQTVETIENESQDIIIDDGSHQTNDKLFVLRNYWAKVKSGGWLIIEDFHAKINPGVLNTAYDLDYDNIYIFSGHPTHSIFRNFPEAEEGIVAIQKK